MREKSDGGIGLSVGGPSILVIFVLLCLTTFATLSLVSANADYRLAQKSVGAALDYYAADCAAEELVERIDGVLASAGAASSPDDYFGAVYSGLMPMEEVFFQRTGPDRAVVSFELPLNETQALSAELELFPPSARGARYRVSAWKVVVTAELETFEFPELWDGNPLFIG